MHLAFPNLRKKIHSFPLFFQYLVFTGSTRLICVIHVSTCLQHGKFLKITTLKPLKNSFLIFFTCRPFYSVQCILFIFPMKMDQFRYNFSTKIHYFWLFPIDFSCYFLWFINFCNYICFTLVHPLFQTMVVEYCIHVFYCENYIVIIGKFVETTDSFPIFTFYVLRFFSLNTKFFHVFPPCMLDATVKALNSNFSLMETPL